MKHLIQSGRNQLHPRYQMLKVSFVLDLLYCLSSIYLCSFEEYGYGTIAVVIVSLLALIGIILLPCFRRSLYDDILMMLTALAVSTLFCDVMFHILPEILTIYSHDENQEESKIRVSDFAFKIIGAVFGNSLFFFIFIFV